MFEQSLVPDTGQGRKGWTFAASCVGELLAVSVLAILPLLYTEALPVVQAVALRLPSPEPPPPPPKPSITPSRPPVARTPRIFRGIEAPRRIPGKIAPIVEQPSLSATGATSDAHAFGVAGGVDASFIGVPFVPVAPPPPPRAARAASMAPAKPVPVGGNVQAARLMKKIVPVYPPLARAARISGVVKLIGIVSKDGAIEQLQVVSGHPLLVRAAVEAVRQWVYRPTLLNGQAVDVIAPIEVIFTLGQ